MTLLLLASHYRHHAYEEFKALVDFLMAARTMIIDREKLTSLATEFGLLPLVRLCAMLCIDLFGPVPVLDSLMQASPSMRERLARKLMIDEMLPYANTTIRIRIWLRCLWVNCIVGGAMQTARILLLPNRGELVLTFGRAFTPGMYVKYYAWRIYQVVMRSRERLTGLNRRISKDRGRRT
jgi:hypothetical protein